MKTGLLFLSLLFSLFMPALSSAKRIHLRPSADRYFAAASPDEKYAFLRAMPKGADLDVEIYGSAYAETIMARAAKRGDCLDKSMTLTAAPCTETQTQARQLLSDHELYRAAMDACSFPVSLGTDRDRFFKISRQFEQAGRGTEGEILARLASRAAKAHVLYLEVEVEPADGAGALGKRLGWDGNFQNTLLNLENNGIANNAKTATQEVLRYESEKNMRLKCGTPDADPGCKVAIGFLYGVERTAMPGIVFAKMATGIHLADTPHSGFSGILLKGPEDESTQRFNLHMKMLDFFKSIHPGAPVAVNAGELNTELATPEDLSFHVSEAVMLGHATRIGGGSDIVHEVEDLPKKLAKMRTLIDVCPSRIHAVLGENNDPLRLYMKYGVPVALSSCDAGILRSELPAEYLKASLDNNLTYGELKRIVRTSLEQSFLPGKGLWINNGKFIPVRQCQRDAMVGRMLTSFCQDYLNANRKAKLEWQLEAEFKAFERRY